MTDEFVDFYEILELPLDADRSEVRKRISEIYIEAQRNLDHRNFNTRVHYQQLFEIILPQARYILLDEGRRDDYDRLVRASRGLAGDTRGTSAAPGATAGAATASQKSPQTTEIGQGNSGFKKSPTGAAGEAPRIDALPKPRLTRNNWNESARNSGISGSADCKARWSARPPGKKRATTNFRRGYNAARRPHRSRANRGAATAIRAGRTKGTRRDASARFFAGLNGPESNSISATTQKKFNRPTRPRRPPLPPAPPAMRAMRGVGEPRTSGPASGPTPQQIEEGRLNHQREVIRAELENTGLKGLLSGGALVLLPGVIAMTLFMSHYYPANKVSTLPIKSAALAWLLWFGFLADWRFSAHRCFPDRCAANRLWNSSSCPTKN